MKSMLITGASRGIGKATAEKFLSGGWNVYGTSTTGKINIVDPNFYAFELDLAVPESITKFVETFGANKIDVLINNAGLGLDEGTKPIQMDILRKTMEVNLFGPINLTELLIENINKNGVIINLSSQMGAITVDYAYVDPSYRISKAAINMFTRNLYKDPRIVNKNIKVCSFDPGWVQTDMGGKNAPRKPEEPADELFRLSNMDFENGQFYQGLHIRPW